MGRRKSEQISTRLEFVHFWNGRSSREVDSWMKMDGWINEGNGGSQVEAVERWLSRGVCVHRAVLQDGCTERDTRPVDL